mmetsp:Transcript_6423/g.17212  ORF Transcript_6423/g.17212 Transcript_6423/m.17212 type:complete len:219 (-) Transcript_6423:774-1430(-)
MRAVSVTAKAKGWNRALVARKCADIRAWLDMVLAIQLRTHPCEVQYTRMVGAADFALAAAETTHERCWSACFHNSFRQRSVLVCDRTFRRLDLSIQTGCCLGRVHRQLCAHDRSCLCGVLWADIGTRNEQIKTSDSAGRFSWVGNRPFVAQNAFSLIKYFAPVHVPATCGEQSSLSAAVRASCDCTAISARAERIGIRNAVARHSLAESFTLRVHFEL